MSALEDLRILTPALYSAAMEVLTGTPLHDPTYSFLLTKDGRRKAQLIKQLWLNSEGAIPRNGKSATDASG